MVNEETEVDLYTFLNLLDECCLSGLQKCWGCQYMVLPKLKWPLAMYDIPLTTVRKWEQ